MRLTERYGLRVYDAVQLASALEVNWPVARTGPRPTTIVSSDAGLNAAAKEGGAIEDPSLRP
jgi:hypothetical protein